MVRHRRIARSLLDGLSVGMADSEDLHGLVFDAIKDTVNASPFTVKKKLANSFRSKN
jgi:hypothetical protein